MQRRSHASLDISSRGCKAEKILRIVAREMCVHDAKILEVGTGSGVIANYLARQVGAGGFVKSVDIVDQRQVIDGYEFLKVSGTTLPFDNDSFDLVLSNHVIEHVGDELEQTKHLVEMGRVLKRNGLIYMASPNRWAMIEPHYRLWFLSWFPKRISTIYLRLMGKGNAYDCRPLGPVATRKLFKKVGFNYNSYSAQAVAIIADLEMVGFARVLICSVPSAVWRLIAPFLSTMIFVLKKAH